MLKQLRDNEAFVPELDFVMELDGQKIISGETIFDNEEDALDNFTRRLRALNKVRNCT